MNVPESRTSVPARGLVLIADTGPLGISLALALWAAGVGVLLSDTSPISLVLARDMGAGTFHDRDSPEPQVVAVTTPPDVAVEIVAAQLSVHPSVAVTDVAPIKEHVITEVRSRARAQVCRYASSHLMAGRECSGAGVTDCDPFAGHPWVVIGQGSDPQAELATRSLAVDTSATSVRMGAAEHDAVVAAVSHVPQLVAPLMVTRLEELGEGALAPSGRGLCDTTQTATSDPRLWSAITVDSAGPVVDLLRRISDDLAALMTGIEAAVCDPDSPEHTAPGATCVVTPGVVSTVIDVITRGNPGRACILGKHGGTSRHCTEVQVLVPDAAGELDRLFSDIGAAGVNIEDFSLEHSVRQNAGIALISVLSAAVLRLKEALDTQGWCVVAG